MVAHKRVAEWAGLEDLEVAAKQVVWRARSLMVKVRYLDVPVAQASYFVVGAAKVTPVAYSWPTTGAGPEESANGSV